MYAKIDRLPKISPLDGVQRHGPSDRYLGVIFPAGLSASVHPEGERW